LRILSGMPCRDIEEIKSAGASLVARHGCAFLLKGGHLRAKIATDILATSQGFEIFTAPFRRNIDAHGTGCTFSAAIATSLACGQTLPVAVGDAKNYITLAIENALKWKKSTALEHRLSS
ncbi:MAG: bifunctional hydroxymethylpyrimidine kinase/phosphomethylpyrimidine kinase, partial [Chthoniobacteraceae bacterium]|nr:bifunctional hydroxymethylpyrimidine kinase/phosphomethylpyrimidine kinase [Chthoniobacteraceae bacterium]